MKAFTIDADNNVTFHPSAKAAPKTEGAELFTSQGALSELAAAWAASRLVEIWNSLPGETPVRKFKDRATAVARIWKAIQSLGQTAPAAEEAEPVPETALVPEQASGTVQPEAVVPESQEPAVSTALAPQSPDLAPSEPAANKKAARAKKAPVATSAKDAGAPREGSKTSQVIAMLKREGGTTLEEIMTEMGWLKHTTRAMLSAGGSLTKKHGLVVTSEKVGEKRVYSIKACTNERSFPPAAGLNPGGFFSFVGRISLDRLRRKSDEWCHDDHDRTNSDPQQATDD
jgi:hypothetical protein